MWLCQLIHDHHVAQRNHALPVECQVKLLRGGLTTPGSRNAHKLSKDRNRMGTIVNLESVLDSADQQCVDFERHRERGVYLFMSSVRLRIARFLVRVAMERPG